ncbi:transcription factor bHLH112-like [Rhododendron vialii]|uniref:transcription factor bHLH112-like n=1 Tax=Rhododendron vialii TaxID=182163 RepID=UPI00265E13F4|nr:transcription factor bHLH112-like [Rhododendron vialii]
MAEDFQAGVCNSTWWNLPKSPLGYWPSSHDHLVEMSNARSSDDSGGSVVSDQQPDSGGGVWMDSSALEMMGINGISSPTSPTTTDWNHTLFGRRESDYNSRMIQEDHMNPRLDFGQETGSDCPSKIQKEWSTGTTTNGFNQTNQDFSVLDHQSSHGLIPSILLQTLFDSTNPQPQQSPLFDNRSTKYSDEFPPLEKFSPLVLKGSFTKQPAVSNPLNLTTTSPFWNTSNASVKDTRAGFLPSVQTQFLPSTFEEKSIRPNLIAKANNEGVQDSCNKKSSGGPVFKRPRIETPSPLPTFKVRKEKLGDRITALQQLVSPFGKTDTASVLQEAIEYVKFLHDQVNVLSTPYMQNGAPVHHHQQMFDKLNNTEGTKPDLRSRGLCLVPISSTFPVANETPVDFWTPTFGGTYR